jgi:hypothetical protein
MIKGTEELLTKRKRSRQLGITKEREEFERITIQTVAMVNVTQLRWKTIEDTANGRY